MPPSILEMAKDLTLAQIHAGNLGRDDLEEMMTMTVATLRELQARENGTYMPAPEPEASGILGGDYKQSIKRNKIICLECGAEYKMLTAHHIATHGMDMRAYRAKYSIPKGQTLACRSLAAQKRETIRATKPWEYVMVKRKGIMPRKTKA